MRILCFAPHSAIWTYAFPEALVVEAAAQEGHEIVYVTCGGLLRSHCVSMSGCGVSFEAVAAAKERICDLCKGNARIIRSRFGFTGVELSDSAEVADITLADRLVETITPENCLDFVLDGVEVGRIALYELTIQSKKAELSFTPGEWSRYVASLHNSILVLRAAGRILELVRPERVVLYNALYSVNRIVCRLCEVRGIPQFFLHAGENLSKRLNTIILARGHAFSYYGHLRSKWPAIRAQPCTPSDMKSATDHFLEVLRGRSLWAYSVAPKHGVDLRQQFGIRPGIKVITATLSSDDERRGGELTGAIPTGLNLLFPKQVNWVKALIRYVEGRNDFSLIIRVHPREFPNKRDAILSEHAQALGQALAVLPPNVRINWPTDNVSLYDLANITDVFTNAWSSAGKEMAWLGLPVVLYSEKLTLYPPELNYVGTTEESYFAKIEQALRDGWNPERIRQTYRWCAMEYGYSALDISESFSRLENRPLLVKAIAKAMRIIAPYRQQKTDCRKRAPRLACARSIGEVLAAGMDSILDLDNLAGTTSQLEETRSLKREVSRLVIALYGPDNSAPVDSLAARLRRFATSEAAV